MTYSWTGSRRLIAGVKLLAAAAVTFAVTSLSGLAPAEAQRNTGGFAREASPYGRTQKTYEAGKFDYYVMALSWSPSYCAGQPSGGNDIQCSPRSGRPYSFVLHGVWPQFEKGWPQDCATADRGFVPRPVANKMLDIMPSDKLVFHEYRKHGTCSGLGVDGYFDMARSLYNKVKIPQRFIDVTDPRLFVSTPELLAEFVAANPGLKPDGIVVDCGGAGPRLKEVRICFDKGGNFRSCGRNENQSRMCKAAKVYVPPVRASSTKSVPAAVGQKI
jgi:ribonuclease T2